MRFRKSLAQRGLDARTVRLFREGIYGYYRKNRRDLPWRRTRNPYRILVSEIMLQQTQVERVGDKYRSFLKAFPSFRALSRASVRDVLSVWQGLGYNRRAIALKKTAQAVSEGFRGRLPADEEDLVKLPGVGKYTASALTAFVHNRPTVLIETNIRRVFIHFFFGDRSGVRDSDILPLVEKTLDQANPREWYYALMDYGAMLKETVENPNRRSAHYAKQSSFEGSNRQMRGALVRFLVRNPRATEDEMIGAVGGDAERIRMNLRALVQEGLVARRGKTFLLP